MARKKNKNTGKHIDRLREKDGYASDRHDWKPTTGHAFRERQRGQVQFPHQRKPDIFK